MILHPKVECMKSEEKKELQLHRLKQTVDAVYENVPFYKNAFDEKGIHPTSIQSLDDLQKLPFTVKKDLRDHYPFGLFAVPLDHLVRLHGSSGTSGKPTVVGYTEGDIERWSDMVARSIAIAGGEPGNVLHNAYGYGLFTGGLGLHNGSEKLGMVTVPVSGGNTERQILLIEDFKPQVICGTPSYILTIAEKMEELGKDPRATSLQYGIFGAEPWSEEMRATLEERLGIKAMDIYGLSEVMGPGVAMECHEAQNGLHIMDDHFIAEIINPDTLEPMPDGEYGELVFTSLTKEAFPVIRYRTGDIASLERTPCICGRTSVRMSRVKGRIDDMIIVRGVNVFPSEIENCLLSIEDIVPHYQVHIHTEGLREHIELHVEMSENLYAITNGDEAHAATNLLKQTITKKVKDTCLVTMKIKVFPPKSIPRSEGKAIRVVRHAQKKMGV
ncbi:phenylacetate--CoA ligase family protein [Fictibacillus phosphorivorans]|uniref:phenylacetate--CoA ligase family protein n=1 Tax=Fictibacillus phosphorivorans TaxID=1221500 RepID=UPI00203F5CF1|nr:AMP-binding protein [Fictibacillus phosphorivorans]MCM3717464.1 AMP-binding protein [Fictibacillus phosphorivorans]MCM3775159.1 AMP-binding protein [Fictibacillus phosphorivorans]